MPQTYSNSLQFLIGQKHLDLATAQVINPILKGTSLLELIPFVPPSVYLNDKFWELQETATSNVQTLSLNQLADYSVEDTGKQKEIALARYGDAFRLSEKLFKDTSDFSKAQDAQTYLKMDKLMRRLAFDAINGVATAGGLGMTGLKAQAPTLALATNGLQIGTSASNFQAFIDKIREAKSLVDTTHGQKLVLVTNEAGAQAINRGYRQVGSNAGGLVQNDWLNREVETVSNVPVVTVRNGDTASPILPQTETLGSNSDTASMYLIAVDGRDAGEILPYAVSTGVSFLTQYPDLFDVQEFQQFDLRQFQVDGFFNIKAPTNSVYRITGVRL